jgi:putative heme-binding domain-containing protein
MTTNFSAGANSRVNFSGIRQFGSNTVCLLIAASHLYFASCNSYAAEAAFSRDEAKRRSEYRQFALMHEGDPRRGKELFTDEQRAACSRCHTIDGSAAKAGPDLFAIGDKFGRREIIDSILLPSANIAVGYSMTTVETKSEQEFTGVIKQATDGWLELMGMDAQRFRIPTSDILRRQTSERSMMPEGLQDGLSIEQFTDLIEYLVSLKQPINSTMVREGMPVSIPELAKPVGLVPFHTPELRFEHPVWFGQIPGVSNAFFVVEHESGRIWRLDKSENKDTKTLFVDLEHYMKGTRGLLGLALHPRFRENGKYYYAKHLVVDGKFNTSIFERQATPDLKTDSGQPPRRILKLDSITDVHYGGGLQFGPDGYFYIGMGDTGPQEDPQGHGQNTKLLIGKMLRIDVDRSEGDLPYAIPPDNPFVGKADVRPEIWALGFREPWRFSFDRVTGELWVGDVGQDRYEEVDLVRRGENFGWNVFEGFERFSNRYCTEGAAYVPPVFAYGRKFGPSVTGGFVYRGDPKSSFYGVYIFGDYQSQRIWGLTQENRKLKKIRQIAHLSQGVVSFGSDDSGNLYVVGYDGTIYKMRFDETVYE